MDKFAENAFKDAMEKLAEDEFKAWCKFSDDEFMAAHLAVVMRIGLEKVNALCRAAFNAGLLGTLAEYAHGIMLMAFHKGYKARMEEAE